MRAPRGANVMERHISFQQERISEIHYLVLYALIIMRRSQCPGHNVTALARKIPSGEIVDGNYCCWRCSGHGLFDWAYLIAACSIGACYITVFHSVLTGGLFDSPAGSAPERATATPPGRRPPRRRCETKASSPQNVGSETLDRIRSYLTITARIRSESIGYIESCQNGSDADLLRRAPGPTAE